jgi:epoxyqueuosine reductase
MHMCCSNCSIYPLENFLARDIDIKGLWFNPNIHPYTEYSKRLDSLERLQKLWNLDIEYVHEYALDDFLKSIVNQGKNRCSFCYSIRLERSAEVARKMNLDGFTTSLLASPYQKFDMIIAIGREVGRRHGISFYAEDVREGWGASRSLSLELGLYRQKYCGCIYSEMERYMKKGKK